MCLPLAVAAGIATAISVAGTAVSTIQGVQQANAQAKVAKQNAHESSVAAADAYEQGREQLQDKMREYSQLAGSQRAALSANGIETEFGSARDITLDTQSLAREDYRRINLNTERTAHGYDVQAANFSAQAAAAKASKVGIIAGGVAQIGSTILSGASQIGQIKTAGGPATTKFG
jgi:hypothetical protein